MNSLAAAFALLTRLPVGSHAAPDRRAAGWFAFVGLVLGLSVAVPAWLVRQAGWTHGSTLVAGVVVVAWWAWATRLLHWDGLADTADGAWGAHDPGRRLEIMADSSVGAFGAAAVALVMIAQVVGVSSVLDAGRLWPLVLAPVFGRVSATLLVWGRRAARPGGLGAAIGGRPGLGAVIATAGTAALACSLVVVEQPCLAAVAVFPALAVTIALPFVLARPFGGYTGDVLGAAILLVETAVLLLGGLV